MKTSTRILAKVRGLAIAVALSLGCVGAAADILHLESGGRIEGRIIEQTDESVEIQVGAGTMSLPLSSIARIEEARSVLDDYDERLAKIDAEDRDGWLALGDWASARGLHNQARFAYQRVLQLDPDSAAANQALGRVNVDGRWLSEDEAYVARGYVRFEGEWVLPEQRAAIEQQRLNDAAVEQLHNETRAAEARAREAEARAQQAEAEARAAEEAKEDEFIYRPYGPHRPIRPIRPRPPEPEPEPEPTRPIKQPLDR